MSLVLCSSVILVGKWQTLWYRNMVHVQHLVLIMWCASGLTVGGAVQLLRCYCYCYLRDPSNGDYVVPRTLLKFVERAFSVAVPQDWNRLPTELKFMRSTPSFKRSLKTFFFRLPTLEICIRDLTNLDNVMRHRSSCRRRTKSTVDLICWFDTITVLKVCIIL